MKVSSEKITAAAHALGLTSTKVYWNTGIDENDPTTIEWAENLRNTHGTDADLDTLHWAARVSEHANISPNDFEYVCRVLTAHHDALLANRQGITATGSIYPADTCPPVRTSGTGPEHSCPSPSTCTAAPDWWEDHCHIYPLITNYRSVTLALATGAIGDYTSALLASSEKGEGVWGTYIPGRGLTPAQRRDLATQLDINTRSIAPLERKAAKLAQQRSDLYAVLAPYYDRIVKATTRKTRGLVSMVAAHHDDDVENYVAQALAPCLGTYNPEKRVPLQAYLRSHLGSRVVDRVRQEGVLTRAERALATAIRNTYPGITPGDHLPADALNELATQLKVTPRSLTGTYAALSAKAQTLYLDYEYSDDDGVGSTTLTVVADEGRSAEDAVFGDIETVETNERINAALSAVLATCHPKTKTALTVWFEADGAAADKELAKFARKHHTTHRTLKTFITEVLDHAQQIAGAIDSSDVATLREAAEAAEAPDAGWEWVKRPGFSEAGTPLKGLVRAKAEEKP